MATATIYATHVTGDKTSPYKWEMWLNADTKDHARELGKTFPKWVETYTRGNYRRLFVRINMFIEEPSSELPRIDAVLAACHTNNIPVVWANHNPDTYYTPEEFDRNLR